jgi:hypothetical protein
VCAREANGSRPSVEFSVRLLPSTEVRLLPSTEVRLPPTAEAAARAKGVLRGQNTGRAAKGVLRAPQAGAAAKGVPKKGRAAKQGRAEEGPSCQPRACRRRAELPRAWKEHHARACIERGPFMRTTSASSSSMLPTSPGRPGVRTALFD